jgi:hypothetical protein
MAKRSSMRKKDSKEEESSDGEKTFAVSSSESENGNVPIGKTGPGDEVLDDIVRGMIFSTLAVTDDNANTLKNIGKDCPWQVEAMTIITGSSETAHQPLSLLLRECMGLELDYRLNVSGMTIGGVAMDCTGYIAHNEHYVVLSYSCNQSAFDWLDSFSTTSALFTPEEDLELDYSAFSCSGLEMLCYQGDKPRVHSGFYNNFLASFNMIKKYIDPFLQHGRRPRKLFVTGHSLGAGIATVAAAYFMMQYDWDKLPHTLVHVTAGSPRVLSKSMVTLLDERRVDFGNSAKIYRVVKGKDMVTNVPPTSKDFHHMVPPVYISDTSKVIMKWEGGFDDSDSSVLKELRKVRTSTSYFSKNEATCNKSKYDRFVEQIPRSLRDHLPDSYLKPLFRARGINQAKDLDKQRQQRPRSLPPSVNEQVELVVDKRLGLRKKTAKLLIGIFKRMRTPKFGPKFGELRRKGMRSF